MNSKQLLDAHSGSRTLLVSDEADSVFATDIELDQRLQEKLVPPLSRKNERVTLAGGPTTIGEHPSGLEGGRTLRGITSSPTLGSEVVEYGGRRPDSAGAEHEDRV